jgi:hypothetical protein
LFTIRIGYDVAVAFGGNIERVILWRSPKLRKKSTLPKSTYN